MLRALTLLALLCALPGPAQADGGPWTTTIDLITIGPGGHIYTCMGHTAIMVMKTRPGEKKFQSVVYNYGDADFDDPQMAWKFFRGTLQFQLSVVGTLDQLVTLYARENRSIIFQRFNLSPQQVERVARTLERQAHPDRRRYRYHYLKALCSTKVRDLIDDATGGALRAGLASRPDPHPVRTYGHQGFAGHPSAEISFDLFMGRLNDVPQSMYDALYMPRLLSTYLQEVMVPDPTGRAGVVPLLSPPEPIYQRSGPPPNTVRGHSLVPLAGLWILLVIGLGLYAVLPQGPRPRRAGLWLLIWALPMSLAGVMMAALALISKVDEIRLNELLLSFPITDLALIGVGLGWLRGRARTAAWLRGYGWARLGLLLLVVLGHGMGLLRQEPRILVLLSLIASILLVLITRRLARADAGAGDTAPAQGSED